MHRYIVFVPLCTSQVVVFCKAADHCCFLSLPAKNRRSHLWQQQLSLRKEIRACAVGNSLTTVTSFFHQHYKVLELTACLSPASWMKKLLFHFIGRKIQNKGKLTRQTEKHQTCSRLAAFYSVVVEMSWISGQWEAVLGPYTWQDCYTFHTWTCLLSVSEKSIQP